MLPRTGHQFPKLGKFFDFVKRIKIHKRRIKIHKTRLFKSMHGWARTGSVFHRCYIPNPFLLNRNRWQRFCLNSITSTLVQRVGGKQSFSQTNSGNVEIFSEIKKLENKTISTWCGMVDIHISGEFSVYSKQSYQDRQLNYASRCWMLIRFSMYVPFVFLHRPFLTKFPFFFYFPPAQ